MADNDLTQNRCQLKLPSSRHFNDHSGSTFVYIVAYIYPNQGLHSRNDDAHAIRSRRLSSSFHEEGVIHLGLIS